jgi:segregation and condensation protein B
VKQSEQLSGERLVAAVGAIVFASGEPVQTKEIAEALDVETSLIDEAIDGLERSLADANTGLLVERIAGGVRLATRPESGSTVRRFFRHRNRTRLSPAALETLAILAYRQPVTAPEIQAIRGRDPVSALKNLVDKKLVRILGKKPVVGSPLLYGTSKEFLVHFGLNSLDDMPSIEDFEGFVDALDGGWPGGEEAEGGNGAAAEAEAEAGPEAGAEAGAEGEGEAEAGADVAVASSDDSETASDEAASKEADELA